MRQQARRTVAAANAHQHFRRGNAAGGHVLQIGNAFGIAARKTLEAAESSLRIVNGEARALQAVQTVLDTAAVFAETGRGKQVQAALRRGGLGLLRHRIGLVCGLRSYRAGGRRRGGAARGQQTAAAQNGGLAQQMAARYEKRHNILQGK